MSRNVISAKLDIIFKKLFTENEDMLHSFVASMLDIPQENISEIKITNPELPPETLSGKFSRLDLSLKVDDRLVNVEIQVKNDADYRDRTLFYWAKLYSSELKSGEDYSELKQTITINIINFNMFAGEDYHTEVAAMIKGTDEVFSDKFGIHFFELKKVGKKPNPDNSRELWLQFINADSEEELEMISQTNVPIMKKAVNVIYDMSEDTKIREIARLREKALHDEASALKNAKAEGWEEGMVKGRAEGRTEGRAEGKTEERNLTIRKMKELGFTDEQIKAIYPDLV
ncbi:MAG: Rpn family recombination-promoting nuclease/putative transposase [Oscillospiraceae bacterium]